MRFHAWATRLPGPARLEHPAAVLGDLGAGPAPRWVCWPRTTSNQASRSNLARALDSLGRGRANTQSCLHVRSPQ